MRHFHIMAQRRQDDTGNMRKWLVVADNLFDALVLIPDGNIIKGVSVELDAARGPERLIGCEELSLKS